MIVAIMKNKKSICKTNINGDKFWALGDLLHREDGPAIEYASGAKFWYLNGRIHREDGPAIEYANGNKFWYINGYVIEDPNKCHHDCCNNEK